MEKHPVRPILHQRRMVNYQINTAMSKSSTRKHVTRQIVAQSKLDRKHCMDCLIPVTHDRTFMFDFDHRGDKKFAISEKSGNVSHKTLKDEIAKCDLVCANCHRIRTFTAMAKGLIRCKPKDHGLPSLFDLLEGPPTSHT